MPVTPVNQYIQPKAQTIQNPKKKGINIVSYTGYAALGFGVGSGIAAKNKKLKLHTKLAYAAGVLSLIHVGIVEWYHYKRLKLKK